MKTVLVLGSGLAGLTTAVHLSEKGFKVTILEKRPFAGGRTYSFTRDFWPEKIDNGPHVMLGCYSALLELLDLVGSVHLLDPQLKLNIQYLFPGAKSTSLSASSLPAPFHFLSGLVRFSAFNWRQKWNLAKAFFKIAFMSEHDSLDELTAIEWLNKNSQDEHSVQLFWRPMVLATLNEEPENVSFLQLFRVLKLGFLKGKNASRMILIPRGLTETLIEPSIHWLEKRSCKLLYNHRVDEIKFEEECNKITVETNKGLFKEFDYWVSALPFNQIIPLLKNSKIKLKNVIKIESFFGNAILNLHFWYPERLISESFASLHEVQSQWLFVNQRCQNLIHHTLVISSADQLLEQQSKDQLSRILLEELKLIFSEFDPDKIKKYYLVVENNATLVCSPNVEKLRPKPGEIFDRFYIAGDWTQTGLPPTMESAVRSGKMVAEEIEKRLYANLQGIV
ncbi:FAD-dependent oxidoreductase [candidate division KSB1 bacterium]|nr:FAD-dependent oxidoreductase [candidate division KSB1 bacterium]